LISFFGSEENQTSGMENCIIYRMFNQESTIAYKVT